MDQLGEKLGAYGTSWLEVLRYCFLPAIFGLAMTINTIMTAPVLGIVYLAVVAVLYLLIMLVLEWKRPRLVLYERGVAVVRGQDEEIWRWSQITGMKGTRTTHTAYGVIPLMKYGANHFYSGEVRAFSVGVLMQNAQQVAAFVLSKMAEQQLPQQLASIDKGVTVNFGQVQVNASGIGNPRQWVNWSDVKAVHFQESLQATSVSVERHTEKRRLRLGNVVGSSAFLLMGIADAKLGTQTLKDAQADRLHLSRRVVKQSRRIARTAAIVIPLSAVAIVGIGGVYTFNMVYQAQQQEAARKELIQLYGGSSSTLCKFTGERLRHLAPIERILAVNEGTESIYKPFQDSLTIEDRATGQDDLTLVACLKPAKVQVQDCYYEDRQSYYKQGVFRFTVGRFRQDFEVEIVDPQTHMLVAEDYLMGAVEPCAESASVSAKDTVGPLPDGGSFMDMINSLRSLPGSSA